MNRTFELRELAELVGGRLRGSGSLRIEGVADTAEAGPSELTWVSNSKYASKLPTSRAGAVLVPSDFGETPMPAVLCDRVDRAVARVLDAFAPPVSHPERGVHSSAIIHEAVRLGADASIGPNVVVEQGVRIGENCALHAGVFVGRDTVVGDDCVLWPHVVIRERCILGNRVTIHPNAVIGADGLGFYFEDGVHHKVPHIGGVILEDDVEIGACTCVDRSKFGYTHVGAGTKIDNLVQIAHNVRVGKHCVIAAQTGIAGSVQIGSNCLFGGKAGVIDNLSIGDGACLAGGLAIATKDVPAGMMISGFPGREHRRQMQEQASVRRLPEMMGKIKDLMSQVEQLEASVHHQP